MRIFTQPQRTSVKNVLDLYKSGTSEPYALCGFDNRASSAFRFRVYKEAKGIVILPSLGTVVSSPLVYSGYIYASDSLTIMDVGSEEDLDLYIALSNKFSVLDNENILNFSLKEGNGPLLEILFGFLGIDSEGGICNRAQLHAGVTIPNTRSVKELCAKALFCYSGDGDEDHAIWDFLIKHPQGAGPKYGDSLNVLPNQKFCSFDDLGS